MDNFRITKKPEKTGKKFNCQKCDFHCNDKKDFTRHLATTKHKMDNARITKKPEKTEHQHCCGDCGRKYKYRSGLCKHKKKCQKHKEYISEQERLEYLEAKIKAMEAERKSTNEVLDVVKQLATNQKMANDNLSNMVKDVLPKIGNYNNNKISINVFLNEHCKDAMNLTDFVENIKISIEDLAYTRKNGYAAGISNIFLKHLTDMKPTERPIHCSDKKRLKFYVKDENKWEKDSKNVKINKTIRNISVKQIKSLKEWENLHPNYLEDEQLMAEWQGLVEKMVSGDRKEEQRGNEKIIKNLSNTVCVKDELSTK